MFPCCISASLEQTDREVTEKALKLELSQSVQISDDSLM